MPIEYGINTLDPLFTQKLLEAEVVPEAEKDSITKIETLYAAQDIKTGIYYEGSALGSSLEAFTNSEDYSYLIQQLESCFEQLITFSDAQAITIARERGSIEASRLLQTFLNKLKTDFFSDRRALLYGPGKKYLEILAAYIHDPEIDLNFRTMQIINLLSDEGLTHSCAEGCFTRLQYAADNLKNYNNFEIPTLYKNYLQTLSDEIIHRSIILGGEDTITQKIAKWMKVEPLGFEIHVRNFILKKMGERFNLKALEPVQDDYVHTIENFFSRNNEKKRLLENNFIYLIKSFNKRSTATNFIRYLSTLIQTSISTQDDYVERSKFLEEKALESLGQDSKFSLAEALSEETGLLKNEHSLDITITERLMNAGWLALDWSKYLNNPLFRARNPQWSLNPPLPMLTDRYKLFFGNLPLSWISVDSERQNIMSVLQQEQGLTVVKTIHDNPTELVNTLIQTPDDLAFFFNQLAFSQQEDALNWINSVPNLVEGVLGYYSQNPATYDLLEPLFSFLNQLESEKIKKSYAAQFDLKEKLQARIEHLSKDSKVVASVCTGLIKTASTLRIIDFSDFVFFKKNDPSKSHGSYLLKVDFSKMPMNNVRFYEGVSRCSFAAGELTSTFFYAKVFSTDFTLTTLQDVYFAGTVELSVFNTAKLVKVAFEKVDRTNFNSALLTGIEFKELISACNFSNAKITTAIFLQTVLETEFHSAKLDGILFNGKVSFSRFMVATLKNVEFYQPVIQGIFSPTDFYHVDFFASVSDCEFNLSTLYEVTFYKVISRSIFSKNNLREVVFLSGIFETIFDSASCIKVEFNQFLKKVNFINFSLLTAKFDAEIEDCNFSHANLSKVNFLKEITKLNFKNVHLDQVLFYDNLKKCDFIDSGLYASNFNAKKLNDINFINTVLLQVHFLESHITESQFTLSNLILAKFENSILEQVSFNKAKLEGAIFKNIQFIQVDFIESNLRNAEFSHCDLSLINFQDSNVNSIKLKESIITPQQLFDTFYNSGVKDFSEVILSEPSISKTDFLFIYSKQSLEDAKLSASVFKELTRLGYRNFAKTDLSNLNINEFIHLYNNIEYNFREARMPEIFSAPRPNVQSVQRSPSLSDCLPNSPRNKRSIPSCDIHWSDIDLFNLNVEDNRNFEEIIIDPVIFIDTLFSTQNPKKQAKLVELIDSMDTRGGAAVALRELRITQQLKQHFYRVGNLCNALQQGLIYENIVMDFIHEDYSDVAINVGLLTGSHLSEHFAEQVLLLSKKLSISKRVFFSKLLKFSAPFLRRGLSSAYIIYDLVKQAHQLADHKKYALNNILQDSCLISFDVMEAGIEVLDFSQLSQEIADLVKSTGTIVNTLILGGVQAYQSARRVAEIKALIPLSPLETLKEGLEAFLNINPSQDVQRQLEYNLAYDLYSRKIKNFLKNYPTIKYYIVPIIDLVGEYSQYKICGITPSFRIICRGAIKTHIEIISDSTLFLKKEAQLGLLFEQLNPLKNHFESEEIFCNPYRINVNAYIESITCDSAIVIVNPWSDDVHNQTLIALEGGYDTVYSFSDSPNIFIVNEGYKIYVGGNDNDRFVVKASSVKGRLDASSGSDLLDLRFYQADNQVLIIDLVNQTLTASASERLTIRNFERILGRSHRKDSLFVTHRTEFIDLQGGLELAPDEIIIAPYIHNPLLEIIVRPETVISNFAISGNFIYRVLYVEKYPDAIANSTHHAALFFANFTSMINHTFLFDHDLEDLNFIEMDQEINETVLRLNFKLDEDIPANHSVTLKNFPIPAHYFFKDDTHLKIGQKSNLYAFQTSSLPVSNLIERYAPLASRLGITFFIHQRLSNEVVVIGHTNHQVLKNDLSASKSHLVANGGGNSYVIMSDESKTTLPISDVILYQLTTDETQHVLDLRELYKGFTEGVLQPPLLDIVVLTVENDLQLSLLSQSLPKDSEQVFNQTSVVKVLLKQGTQWYQKLTILCNRTPLHLVEVEANLWQLSPQPLHFDAIHENIILTNDDIEKDNQIFLHRPIHQHHWLRDGSDVWLTTLFTAKSYLNKNYTILFKDFNHQPNLRTLRLIFSNATLLLSDCVEQIAQAEDFRKKLTSLELTAWNAVSKHRTGVEGQQHSQPVQSKVIDHREFYSAKVLTAEAMTSGAPRVEGWLNSFVNVWIDPLRNAVQTLFPINNQPIVALAAANNATAHHQSHSLNHCIPGLQYAGAYRKGITCYAQTMQMLIFPKNEQAPLTSLKDNYSKQGLRPIECNGRPAVYFEGEQTHVFYIPEIPVNPLDRLNDQLLLSQVLFHEGKKIYGWFKSFFTVTTSQSPWRASDKTRITHANKKLWKENLDNLEKQLKEINSKVGETVDLHWIKYILEDRRDELDRISQLSTVKLDTIHAFTENLQALQAELVEINEDIGLVRKRDDTYHLSFKKDNVMAQGLKQGIFFTKENLRLAHCKLSDLNSAGSVPKLDELNTSVQLFYGNK